MNCVLSASVEVGSKPAPFERRKGCGTHALSSDDRPRVARICGVRDDRFLEIACVTNHFAFFLAFFFDVGLLFDLDAGRGFCGAA